MTSDGKNTVGNTYLTFASPSFPQATKNISMYNSGGVLFWANNALAVGLMTLDQSGNLNVGQTVTGTTGTITTNANAYNAITASGAAGGFLGATYQAGSTATNAFTCTTISTTTAGCGIAVSVVNAAASAFNAVQANSGTGLNGGMNALSFTAANYIQTGHSASIPGLTGTSPNQDTIHQGETYWNDTYHLQSLYTDGAVWSHIVVDDGTYGSSNGVACGAGSVYTNCLPGNVSIGATVTAKLFDTQTCSSGHTYQTQSSSFFVDCSGNVNGQQGNFNSVSITSGGFLAVNGSATSTFTSGATFNGGIQAASAGYLASPTTVANTSNSLIFIGTGGNLFLRTAGGGPTCTAYTIGLFYYDVTNNYLWVCGDVTSSYHAYHLTAIF